MSAWLIVVLYLLVGVALAWRDLADEQAEDDMRTFEWNVGASRRTILLLVYVGTALFWPALALSSLPAWARNEGILATAEQYRYRGGHRR